eukprot:2502854-Amphidinium_carterae.1
MASALFLCGLKACCSNSYRLGCIGSILLGVVAVAALRGCFEQFALLSHLPAKDVDRCDVQDLFDSEYGELHRKAMDDWAKRFDETYQCVGLLDKTIVGSCHTGRFPLPGPKDTNHRLHRKAL